MKLLSQKTQPNRFSKQTMTRLLAVTAGVVVSVGLSCQLPGNGTRFQFQQQVGTHILSGSFTAVDINSDGVFDLSELKTFQATWGNYNWNQEDLEAFIWEQKATPAAQEKPYQLTGFNLFARHQTESKTQMLQILNQAVVTSKDQTYHVNVSGVEYSNSTPDKTLFSDPNLELDVSQSPSHVKKNSIKLLLGVGLLGLFFWQPSVPPLTPQQKPLQGLNYIR